MKLISWNTAHRLSRASDQAEALLSRKPDVVALQEVTRSTAPKLATLLADGGLSHVSMGDTGTRAIKRSYTVLIASRFELSTAVAPLHLPWPEKSLSAVVDYRGHPVDLHTVHIPPGSSNGWIKIDCLEAVFRALALHSSRDRVLCGDFNTPQFELGTSLTITWAQKLDPSGEPRTLRSVCGGPGEKWDAAERSILLGLAEFDLADVFRTLHGYDVEAYSWVLHRKGAEVRRRFDHVFASRRLNPVSCQYLQSLRESGLSDHAPIEVEFEPAV